MREINTYTLNKVERCVCEYFDLSYEEVITKKSRQRDCASARHLIFRILHDDFGYSSSILAAHYGCEYRWFKQICANVRSRCNIYKEYKKHYDIITTVLLDLDVG